MIKRWEADQRVLWYEAETLSFPRKIKAAELYDDVAQQATNEAQRVVFFISQHAAKSATSRILFFKASASPLNTEFLFDGLLQSNRKNIWILNGIK